MPNDIWLREIGIDLMADPQRLSSALKHELGARFEIPPHHHRDELQLDLIFGCEGRVFGRDRWLRFSGSLGLVTYPGGSHGYQLTPLSKEASVYHIKLRVRHSWALVQKKLLPTFAKLNPPSNHLEADAGALIQELGDPNYPRIDALLNLLRLLRDWPMHAAPSDLTSDAPIETDTDIEAAVTLIEERLQDPPTADEIAQKVGVSTRHLSRLFQKSLGMTPNRYMTIRRLDRARVLLLRPRTQVARVAEELGFASHATFSRWFRQQTGTTPQEFQNSPSVF